VKRRRGSVGAARTVSHGHVGYCADDALVCVDPTEEGWHRERFVRSVEQDGRVRHRREPHGWHTERAQKPTVRSGGEDPLLQPSSRAALPAPAEFWQRREDAEAHLCILSHLALRVPLPAHVRPSPRKP